MTESIIVAAIAFIGTVIGSISGVLASAKMTNYRIKQLEMKVDKHNGFAEKIPVMCERIDRLEEDVKEIKHALPIKVKEGR